MYNQNNPFLERSFGPLVFYRFFFNLRSACFQIKELQVEMQMTHRKIMSVSLFCYRLRVTMRKPQERRGIEKI